MSNKGTKKYSRDERKRDVLFVLRRMSNSGGLTVHQIAFWLQMSPSTHLRGIVAELVTEGLAYDVWQSHRPNVRRRVYQITLPGLSKVAQFRDKPRSGDQPPF